MNLLSMEVGTTGGASGKESACQCRRHKGGWFNPWVGKMTWRRAWQPTAVFLLGESHGRRRLAGYSPQGHKEADTTEATQHTQGQQEGFQKVACVLPRFSVRLFATLWTVAHQAPLPMGLSRQEYQSGLPCSPQGIFLTQGSDQSLLGLLYWEACFLQ